MASRSDTGYTSSGTTASNRSKKWKWCVVLAVCCLLLFLIIVVAILYWLFIHGKADNSSEPDYDDYTTATTNVSALKDAKIKLINKMKEMDIYAANDVCSKLKSRLPMPFTNADVNALKEVIINIQNEHQYPCSYYILGYAIGDFDRYTRLVRNERYMGSLKFGSVLQFQYRECIQFDVVNTDKNDIKLNLSESRTDYDWCEKLTSVSCVLISFLNDVSCKEEHNVNWRCTIFEKFSPPARDFEAAVEILKSKYNPKKMNVAIIDPNRVFRIDKKDFEYLSNAPTGCYAYGGRYVYNFEYVDTNQPVKLDHLKFNVTDSEYNCLAIRLEVNADTNLVSYASLEVRQCRKGGCPICINMP